MTDFDLSDAKPLVIGLGEVLWDVFPDGPRFGGAPANFSCTTAALSDDVEVCIVSAVGDDDLGRRARKEFRQRSVLTEWLTTSDRPTGTVQVTLHSGGHADYEFASHTAWDNLQWSDSLEVLALQTSAVCFGTLGQRSQASRQTIQQFVWSMPCESLRILDINFRAPFYTDDVIRESLALANVLKLNEDELPIVAQLLGICGDTPEILSRMAEQCDLHKIAVTYGSEGSVLFTDGRLFQHDGVKTQVVDTVGAGDAFTAALTIGLLSQADPTEILEHANQVAAFVCSQPGGTPVLQETLRRVG